MSSPTSTSSPTRITVELQYKDLIKSTTFSTLSSLYDQLIASIRLHFSLLDPIIKFNDFEGDFCTIASELELTEAVQVFKQHNSPVKLIIESGIVIENLNSNLSISPKLLSPINNSSSPLASSADIIPDIDNYNSADEDEEVYNQARNNVTHNPNQTQQDLNKQFVREEKTISSASAQIDNNLAEEPVKMKSEPKQEEEELHLLNSRPVEVAESVPVVDVNAEKSVEVPVIESVSLESPNVSNPVSPLSNSSNSAEVEMKSSESASNLAPLLSSFFNDQLVLAALESPDLNREILAGASLSQVVESIVLKSPQLQNHPFVQRVRSEVKLTENQNNSSNNSQVEMKYSADNMSIPANNNNVNNPKNNNVKKNNNNAVNSKECWFSVESKKFARKIESIRVRDFFHNAFSGVKDFIEEVVCAIEGKNSRNAQDVPFYPQKPVKSQQPAVQQQQPMKPVICHYTDELSQLREMGLIHNELEENTCKELLNGSKGNVDQVVQWLVEKINVE